MGKGGDGSRGRNNQAFNSRFNSFKNRQSAARATRSFGDDLIIQHPSVATRESVAYPHGSNRASAHRGAARVPPARHRGAFPDEITRGLPRSGKGANAAKEIASSDPFGAVGDAIAGLTSRHTSCMIRHICAPLSGFLTLCWSAPSVKRQGAALR